MSEPLFISRPKEAPGVPHGDDRVARHGHLTFRNILWPLLLSLIVLVLIAYFTFDARGFRNILSTLNPWFIAAAAGTIVLRVTFGAWRFSYISRGQIGYVQGLRGQLAWDFFSNATPAALGGGPFAALYVARDSKIHVGESTALVLFTILLDQLWAALMIPTILICALYMAVIPTELGSVGTVAVTSYFLVMLIWAGILGYATLFHPELLQRMSDRIFRIKWLRKFRKRVATEMAQMSDCAKLLRSQPPSFFIKAFLLTAATWIPRYLLPVFLVLSVFSSLDSVLFFFRGITMMVASFIVPTPGGAGGIEGLYALFLGPLMPKTLVAPTLFLWRFFGYYIFVALGGLLFWRRRKEAVEHDMHESNRLGSMDEYTVPAQTPEPEFADSED